MAHANQAANQREESTPATGAEPPEPVLQRAPSYKARYGRVEAAVWEREREGRTAYSVTLQRSYQDREGKWQRTSSLDEGDLLPAAKALEDVYAWIQKGRQGAWQEQRNLPPVPGS